MSNNKAVNQINYNHNKSFTELAKNQSYSMKYISVAKALRLYQNNESLKGGFGYDFGKGLQALNLYQQVPKMSCFRYIFKGNMKNIQQTVHGGALATMIDVATTIGILRISPLRTISISLNTEFLSVIKINQQVRIQTQISKIGKNVVFTDCSIFTQASNFTKLACKGSHIKSIINEEWNFMRDAKFQGE